MSDEMENTEREELEAALKRGLREPVPLPGGFAEQVLARALGEEARRRSWQRRAIAAGLVGAAVLGAAGDGLYRRAEEQARVRQQVALAMHITNQALATALAHGLDGQIGRTVENIKEAGR